MGGRNLPEEVINIICPSWKYSATSRYEVVLRKWKNYSSQRDAYPLVTDMNTVLDYLHGMYKRG